jgi:universal stress protein A
VGTHITGFDGAGGLSVLAVPYVEGLIEISWTRAGGVEMAFPFKRILVPVDFDQSSLKALEIAAAIAKQNDGTVFVLHVVPVDMDVSGMPQYVDLIKKQENLDREKLNEVVAQLMSGVKVEILDEMGPPADVITEVATKLPVDLIALVTHGRRGLARLVEGSIAEKVLRTAPCPVLSVRQ